MTSARSSLSRTTQPLARAKAAGERIISISARRRGSDEKRFYLQCPDDWAFHAHVESLSRSSASAPSGAGHRCAQYPAFTTQSAVQPGDPAHKAAVREDRLRALAKARGLAPCATRFFEHGVA